ncbi:MAG: hypothetical protein LUD72_11340 [Bacteroidales bacterium]|nr:hypothetical protein [Bacteroidales bacterium]
MTTIKRDAIHTALDAVLDTLERGNITIVFEFAGRLDIFASATPPGQSVENWDVTRHWTKPTAKDVHDLIDALEKLEADTNRND